MWKIKYIDNNDKLIEYFRDPLEYWLEKKIDETEFRVQNTYNELFLYKKGNQISYEITIYKIKITEIVLLQQLDGKLVTFYPDYENKPYYFEKCYFWFYYDDFNRKILDFVKINLTRNKLQLLSNIINIDDIHSPIALINGLVLSFNCNFNGIVNIYIIDVPLNTETNISNGMECKNGSSMLMINGLTTGFFKIKIENANDYLMYSTSNIFEVQ